MNIFSLLSSLETAHDPQEEDGAAGRFADENIGNDGSERTNRNNGERSSSSDLVGIGPRGGALSSIAPRSPAKTPPRPTSRIDDRMRIRRCKSSGIPISSGGGNDDDDDDDCSVSTPASRSPDSPPNKNENDPPPASSPLQQRIARARDKRQAILMERTAHIDAGCKERELLACRLREDATIRKVARARIGLARSPVARGRRDAISALRARRSASLESRAALAQRRLERHLFERQSRACRRERVERADRRRMLASCEKRAGLLAALDARHGRARSNSHRLNEEKASRAGEDIVRAREVARRVKACRKIQCLVRGAYGLGVPGGGNANLTQHGAAQRLQKWSDWRAHVCRRRLFAGGDVDGTPRAIYALEKLLRLFPLPSEGGERHSPQPPTFEHISQVMMQPETLQMADSVVHFLRPLGLGGASADRKSSPVIDSRTLLAIFLIAVHPHEVLGGDFDTKEDRASRGSRLLGALAVQLILALQKLTVEFEKQKHGHIKFFNRLLTIKTLLSKSLVWFNFWKMADMDVLLANLSTQLEQSWVVYLTSCETLNYLAEVTGGVVHGPLMSLKIRHDAGRDGSRGHIKRCRLTLNKLLGEENGKEVVKNAKAVASKDIEESRIMEELKGEIDEIRGGLGTALDHPRGGITPAHSDSMQGMEAVDFPLQILSNVEAASEALARFEVLIGQGNMALDRQRLVHNILLTDASDFHRLSWDGTNAQQPNSPPEEFMISFLQRAPSPEERNNTALSVQDMPAQVVHSMRLAFFTQVAHEIGHGNFESVRELLKELHSKMRSLIPSRKELHSHINDEDVSVCASLGDIIRILIRSGYLLASYLESAARAGSTRDLIDCLEGFNSNPRDGSDRPVIPYGIETENMFVVASTAYILHKAELCQADIHNYELSQVAPILHTVGHDYERKHFQNMHGDYTSCTMEEMQQLLPSTWIWVKNMQLSSNGECLTTQSSLDQKLDALKGRGFVDGLLFARVQMTLPELFSFDVECINRIRSEARCCVIASALALHACNISRVRSPAVLSSEGENDELNYARRRLSSVLRETHFDQSELERSVVDALGALTKAAAERDLSEDEIAALSNHTLAVLHGNDPVLKLLDNRVQGFFRFACKWKPDTAPSTPAAPPEMRTGRSALGDGDNVVARHGIKSTKGEFLSAAKKEASRLGFGDFASDLIDAGNEARGIINLACVNYGRDILDRFLSFACEVNQVNTSE